MSHWYVVQTRSNFEQRVAAELTGNGIENYLPVFHELRQWKDRRKMVDVPVFRGYLFTRFARDEATRLVVLRSDGVVRLLGSREILEPVPNDEIESLRLMLSKAATRCLAHPMLKAGAWVRVKRGPLKDFEGLLVRVKNQTRLVVSITLLSQSVSTEMDAASVEFVRSLPWEHRRIACAR